MDVSLNLTAPDKRELPTLPLNHPFVLAYHRTSWETRIARDPANDKIVPVLLPRSMAPGTNGVPEGMRDMHGDIIDLLGIAIRKTGSVMLPLGSGNGPVADWNPSGGDYLFVEPARDTSGVVGKHYRCKWEETYPNSAASYTNAAKFDTFVAYWQAEGLIPMQPPRDVILGKISELRAICGRISERGAGKPKTEREALLQRDYAAWLALDPDVVAAAPAPVQIEPEPEPESDSVVNTKRKRNVIAASAPALVPGESAFEIAPR